MKNQIQPEKITVELSVEDLRRICNDIASELQNDMRGGHQLEDDDYPGLIAAWREYAPRYVAEDIASNVRFQAQRKQPPLAAEELARIEDMATGTVEMHNESADLLERLYRLLPVEVTA